MRLRVTIWRTTLPCSRLRLRPGLNCGICWGLTFDMRGGRQLAKPDVARPLDGRVRPHALAATHLHEFAGLRWLATTLLATTPLDFRMRPCASRSPLGRMGM